MEKSGGSIPPGNLSGGGPDSLTPPLGETLLIDTGYSAIITQGMRRVSLLLHILNVFVHCDCRLVSTPALI